MDTIYREAVEICSERASIYRLLGSLYDREVNAAAAAALDGFDADEQDMRGLSDGDALMIEGMQQMSASLARFDSEVENDLACDFAHVFLAAGMTEGHAAMPYESIYTSEAELLMQEARDEVRAVFREEKVMPQDGGATPEDSLSYEFDFLALLCERSAAAFGSGDVQEASLNLCKQLDFLNTHIFNWVDALFADALELVRSSFYEGLVLTTRGFLMGESARIDALRNLLDTSKAA